jgi:dsDNA-specific endonuclease/ATPase MutS2
MFQQSFKQFIPFLLIGLSIAASSNALARDIGVEQRATAAARDEYNQAKTDAADNAQKISAQEKRVADEQARLKQMQDNQAAANTRLEKAKADLEAKEKMLEKAWEERNK